MRYLKNITFQRDQRNNHLEDSVLSVILDNIYSGRAISLGSKIYKIRLAKDGVGKSGGYRSVFYWRKNELIVFCVLFSKNERDNISSDEFKALRIISREYDDLTKEDIDQMIERKSLMEIYYEEK